MNRLAAVVGLLAVFALNQPFADAKTSEIQARKAPSEFAISCPEGDKFVQLTLQPGTGLRGAGWGDQQVTQLFRNDHGYENFGVWKTPNGFAPEFYGRGKVANCTIARPDPFDTCYSAEIQADEVQKSLDEKGVFIGMGGLFNCGKS